MILGFEIDLEKPLLDYLLEWPVGFHTSDIYSYSLH